MADEKNSLDLLGIKPIGDAVKIVTQAAVDGAGAFLGRICLPAAEEFGLLFRDMASTLRKARDWRMQNAMPVLGKAEKKLAERTSEPTQAHPRLVWQIIENASFTDDEVLQDMWAGLLASSCTKDGRDDSNLVFLEILNRLTRSQVRILNYAIKHTEKYKGNGKNNTSEPGTGLFWMGLSVLSLKELTKLTNISDPYRLDMDLDHLSALGLIRAWIGPSTDELEADWFGEFYVTTLAVYLYIRCQGAICDPVEFFNLQPKEA